MTGKAPLNPYPLPPALPKQEGILSPSITVATLHAQPSHTQLIDVRSASEFASGHIPGAINIPTDQVESRLADLSSTTPIVLICQMGKRARMTAGLLEPCQLQLSILEGGTSAWMQAGLPIVRSIKSRWSLERQVRLGAGLLVLIGAILTLTVSSRWLFLAAFIGLGLTFAGLTDICPMAGILGRMPWNKTAHCKTLLPNPDLLRSRQ
jgi:rhodanese-related sulfurtransferase